MHGPVFTCIPRSLRAIGAFGTIDGRRMFRSIHHFRMCHWQRLSMFLLGRVRLPRTTVIGSGVELLLFPTNCSMFARSARTQDRGSLPTGPYFRGSRCQIAECLVSFILSLLTV